MDLNVFKTHKARMIYLAAGIIIFILLYALKNFSQALWLSAFLFSIFLFYLFDLGLNLQFKTNHYAIFIVIAFLGIILGSLYFISPNYDKILHLLNPIFLSILIFYLLNEVNIEFSTKIILTFSVMVAILSLWEVGEYVLDQFFDLKLQGVYIRDITSLAKLNIILDKNDDTMIDMLFGAAGALTFSLIKSAIFYAKEQRP